MVFVNGQILDPHKHIHGYIQGNYWKEMIQSFNSRCLGLPNHSTRKVKRLKEVCLLDEVFVVIFAFIVLLTIKVKRRHLYQTTMEFINNNQKQTKIWFEFIGANVGTERGASSVVPSFPFNKGWLGRCKNTLVANKSKRSLHVVFVLLYGIT